MRLRLGLLEKDLANGFNISLLLTGQIFNAWLTALSKILKNIVLWPTTEQILATKLNRFRHLPDIRAIADCSEIFLETPKDPNLQRATCPVINTIILLNS